MNSASQADAGSAVPEAAPPACAEPAPVTTASQVFPTASLGDAQTAAGGL